MSSTRSAGLKNITGSANAWSSRNTGRPISALWTNALVDGAVNFLLRAYVVVALATEIQGSDSGDSLREILRPPRDTTSASLET